MKITVTQIMKLVKETFDEEISTFANETVIGLESGIDGKESFYEKLKEKLEKIENPSVPSYLTQLRADILKQNR